MKKSIILGGSILCLFCLLMIPNISAMEYQIREETIKSSICENILNYTKNIKLKEKLDYDSENIQPSSFSVRLWRSILRLLLIPLWGASFVSFILLELYFLYESIISGHPTQTIFQYWLQMNIDFLMESDIVVAVIFLLYLTFLSLPRVLRLTLLTLSTLLWVLRWYI